MAQCVQCKKEISLEDSFCRHCGASQGNPNSPIVHVQTGSRSTNIGIGKLSQARINVEHIGDRYDTRLSELIPQLERVNNQTTPLKAVWIGFTGLIGFIGSVASIVGYLRQYGFFNLNAPEFPLWVAWLASVSLPVAMLGFSLRKGKHVIFGHRVLHTDSVGRIMISDVSGACPVPSCPGVLHLQSIGQGEQMVTKLVCTRYPNRHRFDFYPSELPQSR